MELSNPIIYSPCFELKEEWTKQSTAYMEFSSYDGDIRSYEVSQQDYWCLSEHAYVRKYQQPKH